MKSSRVFIKANYIKKAKDDWIYCDAHILKQNNVSMLKLSSTNLDDDEKDDVHSRISNFSNISTIHQSKLSQTVGLKVLCNLSEFKSSEIKPVNFYNTEKFAIKLVPSGILNSKKLFLIPEKEDDITKWCSLLVEHIGKSKDSEAKFHRGLEIKEADSVISNKHDTLCKEEYATIKSRKKLEKEILETEVDVSTLKRNQAKAEISKYNEEMFSMTSNSPISCNSYKSEEIYFALDDNDVYEGSSNDNIYTVCVEETSDSKRIGIRGSYIMKLKEESIELCDIKKNETIHEFPYIFIRRFGAKNDFLRIEAGRKCTTGEGSFAFRFKDASKAVQIIKDLVKEIKKSYSKSQETDQKDGVSKRDSVDLSIKPVTIECDNSSTSTIDKTHSKLESNAIAPSSPLSLSKNSMSPNISIKSTNNNSFIHSQSPNNQKPPHPLYNSINSISNGRNSPTNSTISNSVNNQVQQSAATSRIPLINNPFNRNTYAASFSYRRPIQTNIPVIKDDSCTRSAIYDNIPVYNQQTNISNTRTLPNSSQTTSNPSNLKFTSSYTLRGSLVNAENGQYDNVPNNQRCIKELENMLMDLGIATN